MTRFTVAIVSATGSARKRTIPAIVSENICDIVAIHGRDVQKLSSICNEYSIDKYFVDIDSMLDSVNPDFAFIASPPEMHMEQIAICLNRSIPVLCEKPLSLKLVDTSPVGLPVITEEPIIRIAHHMRHQPGVAYLKEIICEERYGPLLRASMQWGFYLNESASNAKWKLNPDSGGKNAFYDAGIHAVDLMLHLIGTPSAITALKSSCRFSETSDNVSAIALCGKTIVELNASQSMRFPSNQLILDFEDGTVLVENAFGEKSFCQISVQSASGKTIESFPAVNPYAEEVKDFICLLGGGASIGTTLEEARAGIKILEAISESSDIGRTVNLSD